MLDINDIAKALRISKAGKRFRWSQKVSRFSIGSISAPVSGKLAEVLKAHKNTLEDLDLDIRHRPRAAKGNAGNPKANLEDILEDFRARWRNNLRI